MDIDLHSREAEEAVVGALLVDPDAVLFVQEIVTGGDFHTCHLGWVYQVVLDLHNRKVPADIVTVSDELQRRGKLDDAGGPAFLTGLINATPSGIHAAHYAKIVKRFSVQRQLAQAAGEVAKIAHDSELDSEDALQAASGAVMAVTTKNLVAKPMPVSHFAGRLYDEIERLRQNPDIAGLPTGLNDLDRTIGGLKPGKLYLVAGRPAMGKSSLGLQMAISAIKKRNASVLYFSCEMPGEELTARIISAESGIDGKRLQHAEINDNEWGAFNKALMEVDRWNLLIDDRTRTADGIKARSIVQAATGLDLIVVDYIQRVQGNAKYNNRDSEVGQVSDALKGLATDLHVPVVAISSLNRKCEERHDKRPILADLRDSGNLEYDADVVIFIYRDEVYNQDTEWPNIAELNVSKHRGGDIGAVSVFFRKHLTQFIDLEVRNVTFVVGE